MNDASYQSNQRIKDLVELNDELENYFKNTIIPQLFVDARLILRKFTPPAMKHFNFSPTDLGKPFQDLVDNINYTVVVDDVKEVIRTGQVMEKEIQTSDRKWFQMNILPYVVEKENKTNGVIITFVDITERITTLRELERLNASHETFIYSVSHDLKAPLANIEGLVKYLLETSAAAGKNNQEQQKIAQLLQKSVHSMRNIIDDLSELTRLTNQDSLEGELVPLDAVIDEVKMILNDQIRNEQANINWELAEPKIRFSRKNLRSIIYNLISNAIKYRSPERSPQIHFKSWREDGHVHLSVKDNGKGIALDKMNMLFRPYTRLEKKVEGTGIGLYLVKKILENEGGEIFVKSEKGHGAEFIVRIKAE